MSGPQHIVCLTEETVKTLCQFGEEHRIAGVTGYAVRPEKIAIRQGWGQIPAVAPGRIAEIKSPLILQSGPAALTDGLDALIAALSHEDVPA